MISVTNASIIHDPPGISLPERNHSSGDVFVRTAQFCHCGSFHAVICGTAPRSAMQLICWLRRGQSQKYSRTATFGMHPCGYFLGFV